MIFIHSCLICYSLKVSLYEARVILKANMALLLSFQLNYFRSLLPLIKILVLVLIRYRSLIIIVVILALIRLKNWQNFFFGMLLPFIVSIFIDICKSHSFLARCIIFYNGFV